jgi:glycosyltransferase involved in cell wall biosynthesis
MATKGEHLPTRLALVITELAPGGAERCLVELATRLDRSRFSPVVYSLMPPPDQRRAALVDRLAQARIPVEFLGLTRPWEYFAAVRRLAEMLREQQAEIVQAFLFHANVVGTRAARLAEVPHLATGIRVADPRWWRVALERAATASADKHVCVSQSVAESCRRSGYAAEKLVVIPNGIEMERWRDAEPMDLSTFTVPPGRRAMVFVGRLDKQKGLDRFFRELPAVFREMPQHDLVLVGEGPQKATLARAAKWLGIDERVHFVGWRDDVPSVVAAANLVVLPSRWEGMPNAVLEAMAAGKPVVAMQAEGIVELLGLAALDQTVQQGDWSKFRSKLIEITKDQSLARELGQRNQERAIQFSLESLVERYQRLFESLVKVDKKKS